MLIEFIVLFSNLIKYYNILFIIIIFDHDEIGRQDFFFVPAWLLSILTPLLPSSPVSLSYFVLAVPMLECLGKHSCMSSSFPIVILNGTRFYPTVQLQVHSVYSERKTRNSCALAEMGKITLKCNQLPITLHVKKYVIRLHYSLQIKYCNCELQLLISFRNYIFNYPLQLHFF